MSDVFVGAIAACLQYEGGPSQDALENLVGSVLASPWELDRAGLMELQRQIEALLPDGHDRIDLVYGGATKIKGYVFEAPKLPEIRGASALLDWVNERTLPALWGAESPKQYKEKAIIYASGGNILAFAPAKKGQDRATEIEHLYTHHTLTANSVAVAKTFRLIELRYGRLCFDEQEQVLYWIDEFLRDWKNEKRRDALAEYYYYPIDAEEPDDNTDAAIKRRFYNRKTFGELITVLATMTNRRRDERATHGDTRSMPFYQVVPLAEKCDSSGIRPAVLHTTVGGEERELSEAAARKRYVGQIVKKDDSSATKWYRDTFPHWIVPDTLSDRSWEHQWEKYITDEQPDTPYARFIKDRSIPIDKIEPPKDVGQISQASDPRRYVGVIYADGNNVGRLVATLKTPGQYAAVSKVLSDVARDAVFQALATYLHPIEITLTAAEKRTRQPGSDKVWVHPFEILAIGGDDLFILVPGHTALDIAASISTYFEAQITEKLRELEKREELQLPQDARSIAAYKQRFAVATTLSNQDYTPLIGLSAGVIIAQENAPIFFLRDLVEELLKSAKGLAKENAKQGFYGGAVDFMVMKSITMVTDKIKMFRRQALGDDSPRRLTARPYIWHEFAGLLTTVRELKRARVPRSQLYRLRHALDAEPGNAIIPSVMEYLYTRTRIAPVYGEALQNHIDRPWCWETPVVARASGLPPWMPLSKERWETIWPDLLEAYEMVHLEESL